MKTPEDEAFDELERRRGGFQAKRQMAADKLGQLLANNNMPDTPTARAVYRKMLERVEDDDDIQDYKKPWVGLTDDEIKEIIGPYGATPIKGYTRKLFDQIEAKLREKNT